MRFGAQQPGCSITPVSLDFVAELAGWPTASPQLAALHNAKSKSGRAQRPPRPLACSGSLRRERDTVRRRAEMHERVGQVLRALAVSEEAIAAHNAVGEPKLGCHLVFNDDCAA